MNITFSILEKEEKVLVLCSGVGYCKMSCHSYISSSWNVGDDYTKFSLKKQVSLSDISKYKVDQCNVNLYVLFGNRY